MARALTAILLAVSLTILSVNRATAGPVQLPDGRTLEKVDFERHVQPLLDRLGCNAGRCHGNRNGQGDFFLSLMAESAKQDHEEITRISRGRRLNFADPDHSLLLLKATGHLRHKGGQRVQPQSWEYRVLRQWIADGGRYEPDKGRSGKIVDLDVIPHEHLFGKPGESIQLKVIAHFADGKKEDVTCFSDFRVPDDEPVRVTHTGKVFAEQPGDGPVMVFYRGRVRVLRAMVPFPAAKGVVYPQVPENNFIDREVFRQLRQLNIIPSELSTDLQFLRRVTIDVTGTLPTPDEVRGFLADTDPEKRTKKIDALLADPRHAALLATKWCDITGFLAQSSDTAKHPRAKAAQMAHDWFRKRFQENMPYDRIVHGVLTATSREGRSAETWQAEKRLLEQSEAGFGTQYAKRDTLDHYWRFSSYVHLGYLETFAERTSLAFLGVRLECARCHDHPLDGWTPVDHRAFGNLFGFMQMERVSSKPKMTWDQAAFAREVSVTDKPSKQYCHPNITNRTLATGEEGPSTEVVRPRVLGGRDIDFDGDPREALWRWMVKPDNRFFARHFVNTMWEHYFGVGLVESVDSFTSVYAPRHATLLDLLAQDFIRHKFNIRRLERTILLSRSYQLSPAPNESNKHDKTHFARALPRRPVARVFADLIHAALETSENYGPGVPAGLSAIEVMHESELVGLAAGSDRYREEVDRIVRLFGRHELVSRCEESSLRSYLHVLNSQTIQNLLAKSKRIQRLAVSKLSWEEILDECWLATLSRPPTARDRKNAMEHVQKNATRPRQELINDIFWALINTREFILGL